MIYIDLISQMASVAKLTVEGYVVKIYNADIRFVVATVLS